MIQLTSNADAVLEQLKKYESRVPLFMERLVYTIADSIRTFADPLYNPNGGKAVVVEVLQGAKEGNLVTYTITANGKAVVFLEFGAGNATDSGAPYAAQLAASEGILVAAGSYSSTEGTGEYADHKFWIFGSTKMTEIIPTRALYRAVRNAIAEYQSTWERERDATLHS